MRKNSITGLTAVMQHGNCLNNLTASFALITLAALSAAGCKREKGSGENDNNNGSQCPEGYRAEGPACVPIFDNPEDCPGPNEMPKLGGGCRPVGVLECADGFVKDSEGGCEPILPDHECPPGTMEVIGETECRPVGVLECAEGFVSDGQGGCDAILPPGPDPCPPGTIEQIGHDTCQPLGDCGPDPSEGGSPWGNIQVDDTTVFVDETSGAVEPDGTQSAPYRTVTEALQAVEPGGQVAIAAGEYEERLIVSKPVRLTGLCSELVTLRGIVRFGVGEPALRIGSGGSGSEVRGVTLTGPGEGMRVDGAVEVLVEEVEVRNTYSYGIFAINQADVKLRRLQVVNCTELGVVMFDSLLEIEQSVVQGTVAHPVTKMLGRGIEAQCLTSGAWGSLKVEQSLVTRNRDVGIASFNVETTIVSSVIRDTMSTETVSARGRGVSVYCDDETEPCKGLLVLGSLLSRNRDTGIFISGVDAVIESSTVRDTLSQESDLTGGHGIGVRCGPAFCGTLTVERSLVTRNRDVGVFSEGVDTAVLDSLVRSTLPQEADLTGGHGIAVQCGAAFCGTLTVERSLVAENRDMGIFVLGGPGVIGCTVVRDTMSQAGDLSGGRGIHAQCDMGFCEELLVERSIVSGNRHVGIFSSGTGATVVSSVVRKTLHQEGDLLLGWGIGGVCNEEFGFCNGLSIGDSVVSENREAGIFAYGVDARIFSSTVRDTLPQERDMTGGRGINAQCESEKGICGELKVENSAVIGNREVGIAVFGKETTVVSSIVQSTMPQESDQKAGWGIGVQCCSASWNCGNFQMMDSLVSENENAGISITGVTANIESVVIQDTLTNSAGPWRGEYGHGISAGCDPFLNVCGTLSLHSCLIAESHSAGVGLDGVSGIMNGSLVATVSAQPLDGKYGYGIQIAGSEGTPMPAFDLRDSEIRDGRLAGVFYHLSRGLLTRSVVSGGEYSVAMNEGSLPSIDMSNLLSGTIEDKPLSVSLVPAPAPMPAEPMEETGSMD